MVSPLFFYQLGLLALLWWCIMLHYSWPSDRAAQRQSPSQPASPPRLSPTQGRHRQVDTSRHFCPAPDCAYRCWLGLSNIRANGHPNGGPWRQLRCSHCGGYFLETHGTIFHGKRVVPDLLVWAVGAAGTPSGHRPPAGVKGLLGCHVSPLI